MKQYTIEEMALQIIKINPGKCKLGIDPFLGIVIYCNHPEKLSLPKDSKEEWYYNGCNEFTNRSSHQVRAVGQVSYIAVLPE